MRLKLIIGTRFCLELFELFTDKLIPMKMENKLEKLSRHFRKSMDIKVGRTLFIQIRHQHITKCYTSFVFESSAAVAMLMAASNCLPLNLS